MEYLKTEMIVSFFTLRLNQIFRIVAELGILRALIALAFLLGFCFQLIPLINEHPWISVGIHLASILSLHFSRNDKNFLIQIVGNPFQIYFLEYLSLSVPLLSILVFQGKWVHLLSLLISLILIPVISYSFSIKDIPVIKRKSIIPSGMFEWQSGLRKNWLTLIVIYLAALGLSNYSTAIPLSLLILTVFTTSFYLECEPHLMLEAFKLSPRKFLWMKYKNQLKLFWLCCLPLLIIYLVIHPDLWYVNAVMFLVCSIIQILAVNLKYSFYIPNDSLSFNSMIIAWNTACFFFPFLAPIPFLMTYRYHKKALKNLEDHLYDYH